jgi:cyclopropane-fatty-acyl-phospholipid synthase
MTLARQWRIPAMHYGRTLETWLNRLDALREDVERVAAGINGIDDPRRFVQRWRIFLMACAELFWYQSGQEWFVAHYLFENNSTRRRANGARRRSPDLAEPADRQVSWGQT